MSNGFSAKRQLTFTEACNELGVSEATLRRLVARREIGYRRMGTGRGWLRFDRSHLDDFLSRREFRALAA